MRAEHVFILRIDKLPFLLKATVKDNMPLPGEGLGLMLYPFSLEVDGFHALISARKSALIYVLITLGCLFWLIGLCVVKTVNANGDDTQYFFRVAEWFIPDSSV